MAVKIRLARLGCKNRAFYRIVAADRHTPRDGKHLQVVGFYDPLAGSLFFFSPFSYYFHMLNSHEDFLFLILKTWTLKAYWVYFQVLISSMHGMCR
jgi:small subunit ribosomal protein S16